MISAGATALVTGAGKRVGRAIALELADAGCSVAVHYRSSADEAAQVVQLIEAAGRKAFAVQADLEEPEAPRRIVAETIGRLGRLDILVNNASIFDREDVAAWDDAHWERTMRLNVIAPAMLARAAVEPLRRAGTGRIVNIADILADRPIRGFGAYCASKAALVSMTKSLARELAPAITVNAVSPGIAEFPEDYDQALRDKLVARVPLQRAGSPREVAQVVRFLVTTGDYVTGQVIAIDGGRSIVP